MNSVHEQCPNSDSETILSQKLAKCTVCTTIAQPTHPGAHKRAQAYRGAPSAVSRRVMAWLPDRIAGKAVVSWACARTGTVVLWPASRYSCLPSPPLVTIHETVLQYSFSRSPKSFPSHNTLCALNQGQKKSIFSADFSAKNRFSVVLKKIFGWKNRLQKNR